MTVLGHIIKRAITLRHYLNYAGHQDPQYQNHELYSLLNKAQNTSFGKAYNFGDILDSRDYIAAFQQSVPIFDYDSIHQQWWHRALEGEADVAWPGKIKYFALTSGTSGAPNKYIPVSDEMISRIQRAGIKQIYSLAAFNLPPAMFQKGVLILGGSTQLTQKDHYFEGDLSGISAMQIPSWFQHFYKPGAEISAQRDWHSKLDEITKKAPEWDIGIVCGIPAWTQILFEKIIKKYNLKTIHDIWPNLSVYIHGGVSFGPYRRTFSRLVSRPLINIETYIASEGYIAFQKTPVSDMSLLLNNGIFFEFIPFNEHNFNQDGKPVSNPEVLSISGVEEGQPYALLLSTCAGAWRYLIGDVIQFTNVNTSEIIITGRTRHYLNVCGEHLSVNNMVQAIQMLEDQYNISIPEFTTVGVPWQGRFAHKWYIGTNDYESINTEKIRLELDQNLMKVNRDYSVKRSEPLKMPLLEVIPIHLFYEWLERRGKMGGQNKFPRVLNKTQLPEWEKFLEEKGIKVTKSIPNKG